MGPGLTPPDPVINPSEGVPYANKTLGGMEGNVLHRGAQASEASEHPALLLDKDK